ncbi:uncharacterized protein A4U43_C05F4610 [Asparagus officinalis]|uniref:Protein kinase domain-containing protein n=1 Tax=Asparagus officinalis TaxID=4686 RepID=A0A5P1EPC4_ASPOF|nr:uncharacterized protein A4U43_C05F4610 [Asparagus officinalis]
MKSKFHLGGQQKKWGKPNSLAKNLTIAPKKNHSLKTLTIAPKSRRPATSSSAQLLRSTLALTNVIDPRLPTLFSNVHLTTLIPSVSEEAINLIALLCSWDPIKRPTAADALRHSFFQSCLYILPSLRGKQWDPQKHLQSVGNRSSMEQKSAARRYSTGALSNTKPTSNLLTSNLNASAMTTIQQKMEMDHQDEGCQAMDDEGENILDRISWKESKHWERLDEGRTRLDN